MGHNHERERLEAFERKQAHEFEEFENAERRRLAEFEEGERHRLANFREHERKELEEFRREDRLFEIKIDRTEFKVRERKLTGSQIRMLPNPPIGPERDLFEVVTGGSDRKIDVTTEVEMRDGLRFFTAPAQINPGQR